MRSLPPSVITIVDGEISINVEVLAPRLNISAEAFNAEMRKGIVYSVAKTGVNEDAGRTRLTFGYHTRAWTVVVEADGTLVERIAPTAKAPLANTDHPSLPDFVGPAS
ncbi:MAG: hypothetical protein COA65_01320 [Rhodospirillaceae bacterium]|nr:MAG: hypothetical protein COA65_01320 [Rhodospirillaceae bacterium]